MTVLLISNKTMHYRISVYNQFFKFFREKGFDFQLLTSEIEKANQNEILFPYRELDLQFNLYKKAILEINPDAVILFLHLKDKMIWPLMHWLKLRNIKFTYWTKGLNLDDPDNKIRNAFFKYVHNLADGLILYSDGERKYISKKNKEKISTANNTVNFTDYPEIPQSKEEIKEELNIPFAKVALFVGRMGIQGGRKKVDHAIRLFNELDNPDYGLIIVGSGMTELQKSKLNQKNTMYMGEIHDPEQFQISRLFKMADIFLMPGHVGLGINQAFYWGLPIVTEEGNQPPEFHYLLDGKNGFAVKEDDIRALKEKVLYLFENDEIRQSFSEQARDHIMREASIKRMFAGFDESVNKLIGKYDSITKEATI